MNWKHKDNGKDSSFDVIIYHTLLYQRHLQDDIILYNKILYWERTFTNQRLLKVNLCNCLIAFLYFGKEKWNWLTCYLKPARPFYIMSCSLVFLVHIRSIYLEQHFWHLTSKLGTVAGANGHERSVEHIDLIAVKTWLFTPVQLWHIVSKCVVSLQLTVYNKCCSVFQCKS